MTIETAQAWYIYSVLPAGDVVMPDEGVLPQVRVEALPFGQVTVLASLVPRALFDRESAANRTADPEWMAARLQAHHAVNVAATAVAQCLPLAFGVLFSGLDRLGDWITPREPALLTALAQVARQTEWALSLQEDAAAHTAWLERHDPGVCRLAEAVAAAGEGTAFLMARRLDKARASACLTHIDAVAKAVVMQLTDAGFGVLDEPRQSALPAWTVLVPSQPAQAPDRLDSLPECVQALAADMAPAGLSLRLSGPWPAYAFARAALSEAASGEAALTEESTHG